MKFINFTYKSIDLPNNICKDIDNLLLSLKNDKDNKFLTNYINLDYRNHEYVSVQYTKTGILHMVSTIYTRNFYSKNTFRLLNRLIKNPIFRKRGIAKTNWDLHPSQQMLIKQIEAITSYVEDPFYFLSRQEPFPRRWFNYYCSVFNKTYNKNLQISKDKYWVCPDKKFPERCLQRIIYPKNKLIPFELN